MEELDRRKTRLDSPPAQPALSAMTLLLRACDLEMIGFRLIPCVSSMLRIGAKSALRNQDGVISKGCEDYLVDLILMPGYTLSEIPHTESSAEGFGGAGIISTEDNILVGKESDTSPVAVAFWAIVIKKLWTTFILPDLDVTIIGNSGNETIVPHLMCVVGRKAPCLFHRGHGFGICDLIAGVEVGRHPKWVAYPFSKMTRSVSIRRGALRFDG